MTADKKSTPKQKSEKPAKKRPFQETKMPVKEGKESKGK